MKAPTLKCTCQLALLIFVTLFSSCKQSTNKTDAEKEGNNGSSTFTFASENNNVKKVEIPSYPLTSEKDLDILMKEIGDARVVLLGEASHGTSEYYTWRAAISKRLIQEKGFDFIAVEGEWADCYRVNNFIKGEKKDSAAVIQLLKNYNRWPTWMWGNYEFASLVSWLNTYNQSQKNVSKAGFYGLDVYCLWESMTELMPYIKNAEPDIKNAAQKVHTCFKPYSSDPHDYAMAVAKLDASCRNETSAFWKNMLKYTGGNPERREDFFVMEQNALVALNGERYYRAAVESSNESWNIRDRHMAETLDRLLKQHGPESKAIIWEHNTHIGDARYTDMSAGGMVNVGELVRKKYGQENVYIVGFGSNEGTVIASERWGSPHKVMNVPKAPADSWEYLLHKAGANNKIVLSKELVENKRLKKSIGHRAIGVVYDPAIESYGNYVPTIIPKRYDAFIYIDKTKALRPLGTPVNNDPPDLWPSGT